MLNVTDTMNETDIRNIYVKVHKLSPRKQKRRYKASMLISKNRNPNKKMNLNEQLN